ncbi:MAG: capsid cement protein [Acidobacteriota bacterium]
MASGTLHDETFEAENDLSSKQFYAVEAGAAVGQVDIADANADVILGILQNKPKAGEAARVCTISGLITKAVVNGSGTNIAYGDPLQVANGGKLIKCVTDKNYYVARALAASTADGDIIDVMLERGYFAA